MNTSLLGGAIFVAVFAGIILVHELGHYLVAQLLHIDVVEFGVGFPPRIMRMWRNKGSLVIGKQKVIIPFNKDLPFDHKTAIRHVVDATADEVRGKLVLRSIKLAATEDGQAPISEDEKQVPKPVKRSSAFDQETGAIHLNGTLNEASPGTEFTLNWIPLGGFNLFHGEDNPDAPHGLASASPYKRIPVFLAGAMMNLLAGVVVYMILFSQMGVPDPTRVVIGEVLTGTPAERTGFKAGDIILAINGNEIHSVDQVTGTINAHPGESLTITVQRGDQRLDIAVVPKASETDGLGRIGVALGNPYRPPKSIWEVIPLSFRATYGFTEQMLALPGRFLAGTLSPGEAQMGGPRTIYNLFQQAVARDTQSRSTAPGGGNIQPSYYTLLLIISLTISVGALNLLPIPALDGGRIFMALIEIVIRKPIPAKYQMAINGIGFIILVAVLGVFYIKDIINPVPITLP